MQYVYYRAGFHNFVRKKTFRVFLNNKCIFVRFGHQTLFSKNTDYSCYVSFSRKKTFFWNAYYSAFFVCSSFLKLDLVKFKIIFAALVCCGLKMIPSNKMKPTDKRDSDESIQTTPTLRAKGKAISRCFINIVKLFRLCRKRKKDPK